jgi:hypothetical protein
MVQHRDGLQRRLFDGTSDIAPAVDRVNKEQLGAGRYLRRVNGH